MRTWKAVCRISDKKNCKVNAGYVRQAFVFMGKTSAVIEAFRGVSKTLQTAEVKTVNNIQDSCHTGNKYEVSVNKLFQLADAQEVPS